MTDDQLHRYAVLATGVLALVVAVLSLLPGGGVPDPGTGTETWLYGLIVLGAHAAAYAALVWPLSASRPRNALWVVPAAAAYGGALEMIQPHVGRHGTWEDALANAVGACLGAGLGWSTHRLWRHRARARV